MTVTAKATIRQFGEYHNYWVSPLREMMGHRRLNKRDRDRGQDGDDN